MAGQQRSQVQIKNGRVVTQNGVPVTTTGAQPAPEPVLGQSNSSGTGTNVPVVDPNAPRQPTPQETADAVAQGKLNHQVPRWTGTSFSFRPMTNEEIMMQNDTAPMPVAPAIPTLDDMSNAVNGPAQPPPLTVQQRLGNAGAVGSYPANPALGSAPSFGTTAAPSRVSRSSFDLAPGQVGGATSENPEAGGPAEVDRAKIDALLGNVSKANAGILGIAANDAKYSQAQAQLALGTAQAQRNALSLARSGNRRDAAALGARALQNNAEAGAEATRSAALLRGQEEDANKRLKLDAYKAAGELGLNSAALEVDVNNLNMQAATSYLNNLFETNRLGLQLDEAKAERVTNFVRDMALIAKDYYGLNIAERQSVRDDLTRRYGIDEQTKMAMAQLDAQPGFWEQAALGLIGGAGSGGSAALTSFALK